MGLLARVQAVPGWVDARLEPLRRTLPWRAWARYNAVRGNVLAGGVAYFAFFSLFPAHGARVHGLRRCCSAATRTSRSGSCST